MSGFASLLTWSFDGVVFARRVEGEAPRWFERRASVHTDAVLRGQLARYVDIGGGDIAPLSVVAFTNIPADATTLVTKIGRKATLNNGRGLSCTAILSTALLMHSGMPGYGMVTCEFVAVAL